jgi:hypothetical protein
MELKVLLELKERKVLKDHLVAHKVIQVLPEYMDIQVVKDQQGLKDQLD